jgi:hypothetical protein
LIISAVIPSAWYSIHHFSAVASRNTWSLVIVAIRASQAAQFNPQQEISFSIYVDLAVFAGFPAIRIAARASNTRSCAGVNTRTRFLELPVFLHEHLDRDGSHGNSQ